ncbi:MAG: outer membrane beta-barrel protein [Ekhidna sp.]|nr:outer membrane beta-barrel protein [Ekhidna sp.]
MRLISTYLIFLPFLSIGQDFLSWKFNDRYFSFYVGTGTSTYFGELNANNEINDRPSLFTSGIEARLLSRVGARIELSYLSLSESDRNAPDSSFQRQRNLSFESNNYHAHFGLTYYIKPYQGDYYKRWIFDPYLIAGIGYLKYNPAAKLSGERFLLREAQTEGVSYRKWSLTVPFGIGAKFRVNEFLNINAEVLYHLAFTDYLDDVSNTYATEFNSSTADFLSDRKDEVGVLNPTFYDQIGPGATRGSPDEDDRFMLMSIKAEIFLPPNLFSGKEKPN